MIYSRLDSTYCRITGRGVTPEFRDAIYAHRLPGAGRANEMINWSFLSSLRAGWLLQMRPNIRIRAVRTGRKSNVCTRPERFSLESVAALAASSSNRRAPAAWTLHTDYVAVIAPNEKGSNRPARSPLPQGTQAPFAS